MSDFCQICGLGLTDPESKKRGMGPDCAEKYGTQSAGVARVLAAYTDAAGNVTHPRLSRLVLRLRAAERAIREGRGGTLAIRHADQYRTQVANFGVAQVQWEGQHVNNSFAIPGFDEDRHSEADAARPALTDEERAEMAEYDRWVAQLAENKAPLDGCEDDVPSWENEPDDDECPEPDYHDISAPCGQEEIRAALIGAAVGYTDTW